MVMCPGADGRIRIGFSTAAEQLAWQVHWLLLRWSIGSSVQRRDPRGQRGGLVKGRRISGKYPSWEVRVSGVENVVGIRRRNPDVGAARSGGDAGTRRH